MQIRPAIGQPDQILDDIAIGRHSLDGGGKLPEMAYRRFDLGRTPSCNGFSHGHICGLGGFEALTVDELIV